MVKKAKKIIRRSSKAVRKPKVELDYPLITKEIAQKVLKVVDAGLSSGQGAPTPGKMCVEAAVAFAMGEDFGDNPKCVEPIIRDTKIIINDANGWSNDPSLDVSKIRAKGMRRLAIAQLGSKGVITGGQWQKARYIYLAGKAIKASKENEKNFQDQLKAALIALKAKKPFSIAIDYEGVEKCIYYSDDDLVANMDTAKQLSALCEDLVQILIKLKSPGTKFLYLTEKKK